VEHPNCEGPRYAAAGHHSARYELMARLKTDDLGWRFNFTGAQLDSFYTELSRIH